MKKIFTKFKSIETQEKLTDTINPTGELQGMSQILLETLWRENLNDGAINLLLYIL